MLELLNLSAGYGGEDKISGVSLRFEAGRVYAVVGKNGCGKSTLLKACAAVLNPSAGNILLDDRELAQYAPMERARKLSYLPQNRSAPGISAGRMTEHGCYPRLGHPRKLSREDKSAVDEAMRRMDVHHLRHKSMKELSGGECQRVYMAMQLAQDATIMLLDEPTTYMDIEYQLSLMSLLKELARRGKTIVMVLHDLQQALKYADAIIAMEDGKIISVGSGDEMLASGALERIFNVGIQKIDDNFILKEKPHPV